MPRPRIVPSSTRSYSDSPLGQIIAAALDKIEELKLKYPLVPKAKKGRTDPEILDSLELIYSHEKIDVVTDFLNKLKKFLQPYDNYKVPSVGVTSFSNVDVRDADKIQQLKFKLITRKAALVEDIKAELPAIIEQVKKELLKESKKATSTELRPDFNERIRDQLNKRKKELSKQALGIPGKDLDVLFDDIVDHFLKRDYSRIDDADVGCDLVKVTAAADQIDPTFELIGHLFKSQYGVMFYSDTLFYVDRGNQQIKKIVAPLGEEDAVTSLMQLIEKMEAGVCRSAISEELKQITLVTGSTRNLKYVLRQVENELVKTDEKYSFTIAHPMTFEFALFMVDLMEQRPSQLNELLPFLNPEALSVDLHSGATGTAVSLGNAGYTYRSTLDKTASPTNYQFQLSTYYKGSKVDEQTINGAESYQDYFASFFSLLTSQLPHYVHDHADSPAVKSEQARVRLLQQLMVNEVAGLAFMISAQQEEPNASREEGHLQIKQEVAQLESLDELLQENSLLDARVIAINDLDQQLIQFSASYETLTVNDLVDKHGELKAQLALDTENQLDVAYANEPLPNNVLVVNVASEPSNVTTNPIKKSLIDFLAEGQNIVRQRLDSIALRQLFIINAMQRMQEQEQQDQDNELERLSSNTTTTEDSQNELSAGILSLPTAPSSPQCIVGLLEKAMSCSESLELERQRSELKLIKLQHQLSVSCQLTPANLQRDVRDLRTDAERSITQLRQEAFDIYSRHLDSAAEVPASQYECIHVLNSHHHDMMMKHSTVVATKTTNTRLLSGQLSGYTLIREILTQSKKSKIPFKEINQHPFLQNYPATQHTGFNLLLYLVGAESEIGDWEAYRQSQSSYFSFLSLSKQPEDPEFSLRLSRLTEVLDLKIAALQETLHKVSEQTEPHVQLYQDMQRLSEIIREVDEKHQTLTQLIEHDSEVQRQSQYEEAGRFVKELIVVSQKINSVQDRIDQIERIGQGAIEQPTEIIELINQVKWQHDEIETLATKIANYNQALLQSPLDIQAALVNQKLLIQNIVDLGQQLLNNYILILGQQLDAVGFDERQGTSAENEPKFIEINTLLAQQEYLEQLAVLVKFSFPPNFFETIKEEIATKMSANSKLAQRVQARPFEVLVLQTRLNEYLTTPCLPNDSVKNECIQKLDTLLNGFEQSGNSKPAIAFIKTNLPQFEGHDFQATLYKSLSSLMDMDSQIPVDYLLPQEAEVCHETACQIATVSPKKYRAKINALYQQITEMSQYGEKLAKGSEREGELVKELAKKLGKLVDNFVVTHQQAAPDKKSVNFQLFKENFIARAHSEDDVMRRHYRVWKPIVANLIVGLLTVGLALGIKLIYSLVVERRASPLFFDRTKAQESIACMQNTVNGLVAETSITSRV